MACSRQTLPSITFAINYYAETKINYCERKRTEKYHCTIASINILIVTALSIYFPLFRRLVYDFLALDKSGKPRRSGKGGWQQCVIEVMFEDIVELYGYRDYLRIQVSKNPKVHLSDIPQPGERPGTTSDKPGKKRAVDITEGQLIKAWTHEVCTFLGKKISIWPNKWKCIAHHQS